MADSPSTRPYFKIAVAAFIAFGLGATYLIAVHGLPYLAARESHDGYLAAVWDADGRHVYALQRETTGRVTGFGWEFFTPPARVTVIADRFHLIRINVEDGRTERLHTFEGSPLVDRTTHHYRGRIFNHVSAKLEPTSTGVRYVVHMSIPRVPQSEPWQLTGEWSLGTPSNAEWEPNRSGSTVPPDDVLRDGVEVVTVPGEESYPAGVLLVERDGTYRVLARNDSFGRMYPTGVPASVVAAESSRDRIERRRELNRVRSELMERFTAEGLSEGEASLRTHDAMAEMGYYPKSPKIVATRLEDAPAGLRVFTIPQDYFAVGLFQDIAKAIDSPGTEVSASTGTYLQYYDDRLGPELKAWIEAGNDQFVVETNGKRYELEIKRFDDQSNTR